MRNIFLSFLVTRFVLLESREVGRGEVRGAVGAQQPADQARAQVQEEDEDQDEDGGGLPVRDVPIKRPLQPPPQLNNVTHNIDSIDTEI